MPIDDSVPGQRLKSIYVRLSHSPYLGVGDGIFSPFICLSASCTYTHHNNIYAQVSRPSGLRRQDFCTLYFQCQVRAKYTVSRVKSCRCHVCILYRYRYTVPMLPRLRVFPYARVVTCLMEILILTRTLRRPKKKNTAVCVFSIRNDRPENKQSVDGLR